MTNSLALNFCNVFSIIGAQSEYFVGTTDTSVAVLTVLLSSNKLEASVTGSGDFYGFDLEVNDTDVSVTGSGDAKVVCNVNLKARVTGSGDIMYKGNPKTEDTKVAGSGSIKK